MKTAKVTLADATYYLAFDGEAMFTLRDDFGGTQLALEAIEQDTRESFRGGTGRARRAPPSAARIRPGRYPGKGRFSPHGEAV